MLAVAAAARPRIPGRGHDRRPPQRRDTAVLRPPRRKLDRRHAGQPLLDRAAQPQPGPRAGRALGRRGERRSGQTATWDQAGYVLAPGERAEIRGWRKSSSAWLPSSSRPCPSPTRQGQGGRIMSASSVWRCFARPASPRPQIAPARPVPATSRRLLPPRRPAAPTAVRSPPAGWAPARPQRILLGADHDLPARAAKSRSSAGDPLRSRPT